MRDTGALPFKVDLRQRKLAAKLTPAQRGLITRRFNQIQHNVNNKNVRFIKPRRLPKETNTAFNTRLRKLKQDAGQKGSPFKGIYYAIPDNAKLHFRKGNFVFEIDSLGYKEKVVALNPKLLTNRKARERHIRALIKKHGKQFKRVKIKLGNQRSNFTAFTDEPEILIEEMNAWLNEYNKDMQDELFEFMNGLIFINFKGEN